jgi:hypothetical protein
MDDGRLGIGNSKLLFLLVFINFFNFYLATGSGVESTA